MKAEGIYAVLGMPYSGSTLLSFIMGSNDQVYNGADLHHLNSERKGICSIHKDKCPVFSSGALAEVYEAFADCDAWYDKIADVTQRPFIFDASKQLSFFREVLPKTQKKVVVVALNKHPMRALASDIYNRLFVRQMKMESLSDIRDYMNANKLEIKRFILKRLKALLADIEERKVLLNSVSGRKNILEIVDLTYESYVKNPTEVFSRLLGIYGLDYNEKFIDYTNFEHHPVTGNMAPIWKVRTDGKSVRSNEKNFRKNFYLKDSSSIVLDDKYKELFSEKEINWIESQSQYKKLLALLNYKPLRRQSLIRRLASSFS